MSSSAEASWRMSSRSIGVTNVWLSRRMIACVIWSPSRSQSRISLASPRRSGYSARISSRSLAARPRFSPARSNRSKNSRSVPRKKLAIEVMGGRSLAAYAARCTERESLAWIARVLPGSRELRLHREGQLLDRAAFARLEPRDSHPQKPHRPPRGEATQQLERHGRDLLRRGHGGGKRAGAGVRGEVVEADLDPDRASAPPLRGDRGAQARRRARAG